MKSTTRYLVVCACLALGSISHASIFYVSPTGSASASGTATDPADFETGRQKLSSVDTLSMRGGQYDFTAKQTISKSGTKSQYKVIMSYPGEKAILDFRNEPYGERGISISTGVEFVHLKDFVIRYTGKNAIINYGNYCIIEGIDTYGNGDTGIQHKTGGGNLILNCDSHDNFDYESGTLTNTNFGGNADGFADKQYENTVGPNTYRNCRAWGNSDDGWDFFDRKGATTYLENCICYNNGPATFDMTSNPRATGVDKAWFDGMVGNTVTTTRDKVSNTYTISLAVFPNGGNGNGFKIGGNYSVNTVVLTNCLSAGNFARGFDQNNNAGSMTLYNCSGYDNGVNFGFSNISGSSVEVKNCVSLKYERGKDYFECPTTDVTNCGWNTSGVTVSAEDFVSLECSELTKSRASDGEYDNILFMTLVSNSDLIDKGLEAGLAYSGPAPDLGWKEYGTIDNYPPGLTSSGVTSQYVKAESAMSEVVFTWSGGATGITTEGLPEGVTATVNEYEKTVTISGTPMLTGTYTITATTEGGTGAAKSQTIQLTVKNANAQTLAYVTTTGDDAADVAILEAINSMDEYFTEIVNVTEASSASKDYTSYGMVVVSPVPGSKVTGIANLESYAGKVPMLVLKPFLIKDDGTNAAWDWGTAVNTSQAEVTLTDAGKAHDIFVGLGSSVTLFSSVSTNGVTGITHTSWVSDAVADVVVLANPTGDNATDAIVEIPKGVNINGVANAEPFLMIGVSEYSTGNLTADAKTLIQNACKYVLTNASDVNEAEASTGKSKSDGVWTTDGKYVGKTTMGLSSGVYIVNGETKTVK